VSDNNFSDIGKRISTLVQDAVNTMDFDKLNNNISSTINSALGEVQRQLHQNKNFGKQYEDKPFNNRQPDNREYQEKQYIKNVNSRLPISRSPAGSVSGVLSIVFGSIGIGLSAIIFLIVAIATIVGGTIGQFSFLGFSLIFLISACLLMKGVSLRRRLKRFRKYVFKISGRSYCSIKELSFGSGQTEKFVVKDLKRMIRKGMFTEGHIDDQQTSFMLTYDVYQQYLKTQESLRLRKQEELELQKNQKIQKDIPKDKDMDERIRQVVIEGRTYISQIRQANDAILGEEVSNKLFRLETVIMKIFAHIENHPNQVTEIRQFTQYYLPTTLKLVNTYKDLDIQPIQKGNIVSAKVEIEKTLDTINLAFENLYDSLFEDVALDVSTDISVLETMLKREGLTEKDFK